MEENKELPQSSNTNEIGKEKLCRSEKKRRLRAEYTQWKKTHRKEKKMERKERLKKTNTGQLSKDGLSKRDMKVACEKRCKDAMVSGLRICVDLSLDHLMTDKEISKVAQQLCRLYGSNRRSANPFHVYFAGLKKEGSLFQICQQKNEGFENYLIDMKEDSVTKVFHSEEIVYLSPDAETVLTELDQNKVYVIGGLVDESLKKNVTKSKCDESRLTCARLPLLEYMVREENKSSYNTVLSLNQVFDILLHFHETGDWREALSIGVPKRKGYVIKPDPV